MDEMRTEAAVLVGFLQYLRSGVPGASMQQSFAVDLTEAPTASSRLLVLQLFAPTDNPERAHRESAVQSALTNLGYPTPRALLDTRGGRYDAPGDCGSTQRARHQDGTHGGAWHDSTVRNSRAGGRGLPTDA
jgi:hypothetical protein